MPTSMPSPSREPADAEARRRERAVAARAHEFEGGALLDALHDLGYDDGDIVLRSHHSMVRPSALVHELRFERVPQRRAVVTLNLGLLGCETPLPSYICKLTESSTDRLVPFFEYFD